VNVDARSRWLVVHQARQGPAVRVVCLPHAGGSASYFPWLRKALPPEAELVCVQYPGRQERRHEAAVEDVPAMVSLIAEALAGLDEVPTVLYGHSLGALLAFELARWSQRQGIPPLGLIVSGRRAPGVRPSSGQRDLDDVALASRMRELGGVDAAVLDDPDLRELVLPVIRADHRLAESYRYRPGPRLSCPVTVLTGRSDPVVSAADAQAWQRHTSAEFCLHTVAGGHFFISDHRDAVIGLVRTAVTGLLATV
jgi:surfactin synthase thioesterase subunit